MMFFVLNMRSAWIDWCGQEANIDPIITREKRACYVVCVHLVKCGRGGC